MAWKCFFLRYIHIPPLFGLRRTWLNGIITYPYPEVTLDTFGFPVGVHWAARRAVFWQRLPNMALFEPKMLFFGHNCNRISTKMLPFGWTVVMVTKNQDAVPKNMDFGPKKYIFNNNNGWSGSVPQVIVHICHVLQCTGFPGPCAPHPSNIFVIHNNMFPKIVKKVFLKKIEKCKCYKRSSSDHQQQHHYHPTTKAKSRILLNCIWAYFKMYLCIWAICICVFVYNKITSYSWWWWWWQIWDWWQWGR